MNLMDKYSRFFDYVEVTDSCWYWTSALHRGYGQFWSGGKTVRAHRFSYELFIGPIPRGLTIEHRCHTKSGCDGGVDCIHRRCVNPDHLELKTSVENALLGNGPAAVNKRKTHCKRGHLFTEATTRIRADKAGARECKLCVRDRKKEVKK